VRYYVAAAPNLTCERAKPNVPFYFLLLHPSILGNPNIVEGGTFPGAMYRQGLLVDAQRLAVVALPVIDQANIVEGGTFPGAMYRQGLLVDVQHR